MIDKTLGLIILLLLLIEAECRVCYHNGDGFTKYFYCSPHEYCCGDTCCQSYIRLSFYRLWYFWLTVIMVLLFCSGSGYWFRRRYYRPIFMDQAPMSNPTPSGGLILHRDDRDRQHLRQTENTSPHPMSPPSYSAQGVTGAPPFGASGYHQYQMYGGPPPAYDSVVYPSHAAVHNGQAPSTAQNGTNNPGAK